MVSINPLENINIANQSSQLAHGCPHQRQSIKFQEEYHLHSMGSCSYAPLFKLIACQRLSCLCRTYGFFWIRYWSNRLNNQQSYLQIIKQIIGNPRESKNVLPISNALFVQDRISIQISLKIIEWYSWNYQRSL